MASLEHKQMKQRLPSLSVFFQAQRLLKDISPPGTKDFFVFFSWNFGSQKKHHPKSGQISSYHSTPVGDFLPGFPEKLGILAPKSVKHARFSIVNIVSIAICP